MFHRLSAVTAVLLVPFIADPFLGALIMSQDPLSFGTPLSRSGNAVSCAAASGSQAGCLASADWTTFNNKGSGTVTSVSGTAPIASSGGTTPAISCTAASGAAAGCLSSTDWTTFNNKGSGTVTSVSGTAPIASSGGTTPAISCTAASGAAAGCLSSTDWTTFNDKESVLTFSAPLSRSVNTVSCVAASGSVAGCLSSTDWTTFNSKLTNGENSISAYLNINVEEQAMSSALVRGASTSGTIQFVATTAGVGAAVNGILELRNGAGSVICSLTIACTAAGGGLYTASCGAASTASSNHQFFWDVASECTTLPVGNAAVTFGY